MFIIIDKPSLSFQKEPLKVDGKHVLIYTNKLKKLSKSGIIEYMIANNKFSALSSDLSVNGMSKKQISELTSSIYLRNVSSRPNIIIDLLLESDEDFAEAHCDYPLLLRFWTVPYGNIINSFTAELSIHQDFQIIKKIGQGTFAEVYLARERGTEYVRVIKSINKQRCELLGELSYIKNEIQVLSEVESEWHVRLYYVFQDEHSVHIVMQYCPFGNIYSIINSMEFRSLSYVTKKTYFIQVALGLARINQKGYLYRDLKPQNILIDIYGNAKICDFGYAIKYERDKIYNDICGSYEYIPPEMANREGYNHSHDLYCLGLFFHELLTGDNPFKGITSKNLGEVSRRKVDFQTIGVSSSTRDIIKRLMDKDPSKRLGSKNFIDIFKHHFFVENADLVVKILKKQKKQIRDKSQIKEVSLQKKQQISLKSQQKKKKVKYVLPYEIYNYLTPQFNIKQKMGPKMTSGQFHK